MTSPELLQRAVNIVRDLAARQAPLNDEVGYCELCDSENDAFNLEDHTSDCPWYRAKKWMEEWNDQ